MSIPKWEGLVQNEISQTEGHTLVRPKFDGFPLVIPE